MVSTVSNHPSVYFVILTWNSEDYLRQCLDSVFELRNIKPTVCVVDNGSTDSTRAILDSYKHSSEQKEALRTVYLGTNRGTTEPRNLALREVPEDCQWVCVLDSDTKVYDDALELMISALENNTDIGIVGPTLYNENSADQFSGRNFPTLQLKILKSIPGGFFDPLAQRLECPPISDQTSGMHDVDYLLSACWMFHKSLIKRVGLLDEVIFYAPEDVDYCLRVHKQGLRVVKVSDARVFHGYQRISKRKLISRHNFEHLCGLLYYFQKHRYLFRAPQFPKEVASAQLGECT